MTETDSHTQETSSPVYRRAEGVVLRKAAGETLLIPVRGRIAEMQNLFVLDGVGEAIWEVLAESPPLNGVAEKISHQYGQPVDQVLGDCTEFLDELLAEGLVVRS